MLTVALENLETTNLAMPPQFAREFRRIGDAFGQRNKVRWAIAAAAVLKLLEMPVKERAALLKELMGNRHDADALQQMVDEAKARSMPEAPPIPPRREKQRPGGRRGQAPPEEQVDGRGRKGKG